MKGRVVVVREYGKPFEIEEYEVPEPEDGAVLLRMTQAGICGSDLHTWRADQSQEYLPIPTNRTGDGTRGHRRGGGSGKGGDHRHPGDAD